MKKVLTFILAGFLLSGIVFGQSVVMTTSDYESGNSAMYDTQSGTFKDKLLSVLRHYRAGTYYIAVAKYGNSSFWKDKERLSPEDPMAFRITFTGEYRNLEELQNEF